MDIMRFEKDYAIVNGPGKDRLFDACKYACTKLKLNVDFKVALDHTRVDDIPSWGYIPMSIKDFRITGIEHGDDSGEKFNLRGSCKADIDAIGPEAKYKSYKFKAFYDTRYRKGIITLEEE